MFDVSEVTVKYWASNECYKKGIEYYEASLIHNVQIKKEFNSLYNANFISINAEVSDDYDGHKEVFILFNDKTGIVSVNCSCADLKKKRISDGICSHIAAVLIKYARDKDNLIENSKLVSTKRFLNKLKKSLTDENFSGKPLDIEVKYNFSGNNMRKSFIELKIGEDKLYVVKDLGQFISSLIKRDETIEYGKKFSFDPKKYYIKDEDKEIIDFIKEIYISSFEGFDNGLSVFSGKKLYLDGLNLKNFFKIMNSEAFDAVINEEEFFNVRIVEGFPKIKMFLKQYEDTIEIGANGKMPIFLNSNNDFIFYQGNIYILKDELKKLFLPFYFEFEKNGSIDLSVKRADEVVSYVLPMLNKLNINLTIDKELERKLVHTPLKSEVFLDKLNDCVIANIKFKYDDISINPLREEKVYNQNKIFVRNIKEEINIVKLFENYNFQRYGESFINNSEKQLVDFLVYGIEKLQEMAEVFYSSSFKNYRIYSSHNYRGGIRVNDENLLEFSFDIEGVDRKELQYIFEALRLKKKYYKLKKGGIVPLENDEIKQIADLLEYLDVNYSELSKESIELSKYNALYIDSTISSSKLSFIKRSGEFEKIVASLKEVKKSRLSIPENVNAIMRNYQKTGFKWFKTLSACGFGGILADEMGLGKTLQAIAFITSEKGGKLPSIVVTPTSLVYNWKDEIDKFSPELKVLIIIGSKQQREESMKKIEEYDVVLTSYPLIRNDIDNYEKFKFKYCFLDEAQQIKNPSSINAKSVKRIKAENHFALTGTPMENSLTELWSIFDFIMPGYLLNHSKFLKKYESPIIKDKNKKALQELNRRIQPFIMRRLKKDVIKELPPKIEHKILIEMTDEQKKVYSSYLINTKRQIESTIKEKGFKSSKIEILSLLTRLRQICCNPASFIENYEGESGKIVVLKDILEESINNKHRILVFSQFTTVLKNIGEMLQKNNINYMYLDGQTKVEERLELVNDFNKGAAEVFLISLKAGGTGLNLTGADVVIHFDPWWNPAVEEQASDRAHRIGQKKTVEVIKLISRGTIEEKIYDLQQKKKDIISNIISNEKSEKSALVNMTENELKELLS